MTAPVKQPTTTDCALVLFAKRPRPGVGKQRIAATEGRDVALQLSQRLFACAIEDLADWPGPAIICIAEAADRDWASEQLPRARITTQSEGNLGQRLSAATRELADDFGQLLFIGCDAPTIDTRYLSDCAQALTHNDVVLGAANDGGVVVMGTRKPWPPLAALPWSTDQLGRTLGDACTAHGLTVEWAPAREDIDEASQLAPALRSLQGDRRPARRLLRTWLVDHLPAGNTEPAQSAHR